MTSKLYFLFLFAVVSQAFGVIKVITTVPDLAWLVKEVGKEFVEVEPLLSEKDNPHYVEAVPYFINKAVNSDLVVSVGLELEDAWLPKVVERTGKKDIQPGGKGYLEVGKSVTVLEKPTKPIDRSMGDVHAQGNPHFWLSPPHLLEAIAPVVATLSQFEPQNSKKFQEQGKKLKKSIEENFSTNKKRWGGKNKFKVMEYHKEFTYFFKSYGLENEGSLEEKPGFPPSLGHILNVAAKAKEDKVKLILGSLSTPESDLKKFKELSSIPYLKFRTSLKSGESYFDFQSDLVSSLLKIISL